MDFIFKFLLIAISVVSLSTFTSDALLMQLPRGVQDTRRTFFPHPLLNTNDSKKTQDAKKSNQLTGKKAKWYKPGRATALPSLSAAKIMDHAQET